MTDTIPAHLGGFIAEGDPATWFPDLWSWLIRTQSVKTVLDIGCGAGHSTRFFREQGCEVKPIDGVNTGVDDLVVHDFTEGSLAYYPPTTYDLGWCCEFLEHIEERYLRNVVTTFQACKVLLVTHAFPGQAGHHHVNCQPSEYWRGFFAGIGFTFNNELTRQTKLMARKNTSPWNHYVRSGMAFVRR